MGSLIRLLAVLAAGLVGLSFIAFAVDQSREGSQNQVQAIGGKDSVASKTEILRRPGFAALGELVAERARELGATAVGGLTMGADPVACAALAAGADVKAFFVRKDRKEHGLERWVEGPPLDRGERCLVVEDVVTTGGSTLKAIERIREEGLEVVGVVSVLDRLAGGGEAIEAAAGAPYLPFSTIDDIYPDRPDRV